jgi:hypothetical protein
MFWVDVFKELLFLSKKKAASFTTSPYFEATSSLREMLM